MSTIHLPGLRAALFAVTALTAALPSAVQSANPRRADIVVADFEGATYGDWQATGTAFGSGPAPGTLPGQMTVTGYRGHGLASSYWTGDGATGTLTSPEFRISRKFLNFRIGGGGYVGRTCLNLLVGGVVVRTATGPNVAPGGSERLDAATWDATALQGKNARMEIVDRATGEWGHISVDDIVQSDERAADEIRTAPLYGETFRPQFHFTATKGWLNDPNGMVWYAGEYHLFFQRCPDRLDSDGIMTWGHAVSTDMVHWKEIADALLPDKLGSMWSGSAVVDWDNTSGFQTGAEKPMVAMYTAAGGVNPESKGRPFTQCIAYSNDRGRTWTKYAGNPVIPHIIGGDRDPKVIYDARARHWVMALYLDKDAYGLFTSPDLKRWTQTQTLTIPGCSECPDFFPLPLDGDPKNEKWVLTGANGRYVVGGFDGATFTPETKPEAEDTGGNYYAVQTFSDIPSADGRRIQIAWMYGGVYPQMPFNQQMSFPCELTLHSTPDGPRLHRRPVREIAALRGKPHEVRDVTLRPGGEIPLPGAVGELWDIEAEFEPGDATAFGLRVRGADVHYTVADRTVACLGHYGALAPRQGRVTLRLLVDRTSLELFGDGGRLSMTTCFLPTPRDTGIEAYVEGGSAKLVSLKAYPLRPAWR
jgi:fructan beta-fructosidase